MSKVQTCLVWFRRDLRLEDNPALFSAFKQGFAIIPVYIWSPQEDAPWSTGSASRWWLHHSLKAFHKSLDQIGSKLIIRKGAALSTLSLLADETRACAVFWNRLYDPASISRDTQIKDFFIKRGIRCESFNSLLLNEPWEVKTKEGKPYSIFTPFYRAGTALKGDFGLKPAPKKIIPPEIWPNGFSLESLELLPKIPWDKKMNQEWVPGELGAHSQLKKLLKGVLSGYSADRDRPDREGTSRLSAHLCFGEISPNRIYKAVSDWAAKQTKGGQSQDAQKFASELFWREFAYHLLFYFPHTSEKPLRKNFERMPWKIDKKMLKAWRTGYTGYPLIDAGMRQLWATGWMHNRVRMIAASFLVKDLFIPWQEGAKWFWDTLVDADLASNTLGWQWVAGCGADAAPFFRIFNPVTQSQKFDPDGAYIRKWVPELSRLAVPWIHSPWLAPENVLSGAGVVLGENYPKPIVDHGQARESALRSFKSIKSS